MNSSIRVRFAPSPTGNLHVGSARTALFNWLFAKHFGGKFILRIEDTDSERSRESFTHSILDGLRWLGIDWDEGPEIGGGFGPYFQTQRSSFYSKALYRLQTEEKVYPCFCSPDILEMMREDQARLKTSIKYDGRCRNLPKESIHRKISRGEKFAWRLKVNPGEVLVWSDLNKGELRFESDLLDDLIIAKSDGMPTYNFAVVIDDIEMKISHVIRGEDHISNTPKQILIYRALGVEVPFFAHIPMILGDDRSRLSKRHGATSVVEYKTQGFESDALRNYLALLGWSPDSGKEILSLQELIQSFSLERISSHGAIFNIEKLRWLNAEYTKKIETDKLLDKFLPWLQKIPGFPSDYDQPSLKKMVALFRERIHTFDEINMRMNWFFIDPESYDKKGLEKLAKISEFRTLLKDLYKILNGAEEFSEACLETLVRGFAASVGLKAGDIIHICRLAFTGSTATPGLFEIMALLGRERCLRRLKIASEKMQV